MRFDGVFDMLEIFCVCWELSSNSVDINKEILVILKFETRSSKYLS